MKIAILTDSFPPESTGGADQIAYSFAKGLSDQGHEVRVFTTTRDSTRVGVNRDGPIQVERMYSAYHPRWRSWVSMYNPKVVRAIRAGLTSFEPDVVHAHNVHQNISYAVFSVVRSLKIPLVHTIHDAVPLSPYKLYPRSPMRENVCMEPEYDASWLHELRESRLRFNPLRRLLIRRALKKCSRVLVVSRALQKVLEQDGIKNTEVFYNGIDTSEWSVSPEAVEHFRTVHKLVDKEVILFGGRLSGLKGGYKAIEYLARVRKEIPDAVLLVMGKDDHQAQSIRVYAEHMSVSENIVFTGWISGTERVCAYKVSDVVITPSLYLDPFPTINLEAMAAGVPVVTTCLGGSREAVEDGITGFVANPFDIEVYASRIEIVLREQGLYTHMSRASHKRAINTFSLGLQTSHLYKIYQSSV